jgi:cobyrinic acid a,c-diamide synthase
VRIGVARDAAFCFYYPDNLELLAAAGARLVPFSPLTDGHLPDGLAGLYFGGGYPELHAKALAGNRSLRQEIRQLSRKNMPIYGECGGFMYLCREMGDTDGDVFPMTGCLPFGTRMLDRLKALGYREITQTQATVLGPAGQTARGHEFHYSTIDRRGRRCARGLSDDRPGRHAKICRRVCGGSNPGQLRPPAFRQLSTGRHTLREHLRSVGRPQKINPKE